ncbi:hypothetical protein [Lacrimispora sp.]|uniref:hypothetical protein n=1 Tax=Lacrimispora sp. TaxID=2719234 RepID=UPI00345FBBE1
MHLESNYIICDNSEEVSEEMLILSMDKLEVLLKYCQLRNEQFDIRPNLSKRIKVIEFYKHLKKLAFFHNGKVSLDIDEEKMRADLKYWSKSIVLFSGESDDSRKVLIDLLNVFENVYFEESNGGIQICVEENLFDEILVRDESAALLRLKESLSTEIMQKN